MCTDYGLDILDPNDVPRGPKFIDQPDNIMAVEGIASVVIDCTAAANPSPTYRMYKIMVNNTIPITTDMDPRYALTNGKLVIRNPTENKDAGRYICTATNPYGTVISQIGLLSFGILGEFSNVQREKVQVKQHSFGMIKCPSTFIQTRTSVDPVFINFFGLLFTNT
ncbi:contactin-5-like [Pomacea canaliculata]|uniref:contactin-5-like n=1 Tax=Pomacea canaliculata TaxID=400727 RepID=UPI000D72C83D|nr:contactin-5-like [Pomacea canaliculata]